MSPNPLLSAAPPPRQRELLFLPTHETQISPATVDLKQTWIRLARPPAPRKSPPHFSHTPLIRRHPTHLPPRSNKQPPTDPLPPHAPNASHPNPLISHTARSQPLFPQHSSPFTASQPPPKRLPLPPTHDNSTAKAQMPHELARLKLEQAKPGTSPPISNPTTPHLHQRHQARSAVPTPSRGVPPDRKIPRQQPNPTYPPPKSGLSTLNPAQQTQPLSPTPSRGEPSILHPSHPTPKQPPAHPISPGPRRLPPNKNPRVPKRAPEGYQVPP
uniref:Uncharacterized protein n=1 Tax=Knipowitschia caucasica TaxID=637954 RepID=A0AAV2MK39_KNICA